ncbi:TonB-dependent receptor domain-containing protein [Nostoc sp.]|uniref:TonB-dependent receptor domain-containing protein n=1 Tax=Nostoc sp. TaxID=1180 RepID=UPI003FA5ECF5
MSKSFYIWIVDYFMGVFCLSPITPVIGRSRTQELFGPERGNQYEVGIKADITNTLSATLAAFEITKSNVLTPYPIC